MFSGIAQNSESLPSSFEIVAVDQLVESFHPAFNFFISGICQNYPRLYPIFKYKDELFYTLHLALETGFIHKYGASFAEQFYNLCRNKINNESQQPLTQRDKNLALLHLVLIPYLMLKFRNYFNKIQLQEREQLLRGGNPQEQINQQNLENWKDLLIKLKILSKKIFRKGFPYVFFVAQFSKLIYFILYSFELSKYPSISFRLLNQSIQRQPPDLSKLANSSESKTLFLTFTDYFLDYSRNFFLCSVLGFKFMEWWYGNEEIQSSNKSVNTLPPPPTAPPPVAGSYSLPSSINQCAICKRDRQNPTVTLTGFVFCYRCIFDYIEKTGECPITGIPLETQTLRRVYESENY
eukprot:c15295_g1_i1.p1 GENE.c15295_g1_i1~~c15295_g1_i1.p1  ORF type:complete len:365 (+),score=95.01 c15295_g1_i1:46-1095(+)